MASFNAIIKAHELLINSTSESKLSGLDNFSQVNNSVLAQESKVHKNIFGQGVIGDGKPVAVPKAPEEEKIQKKDFKIAPTTGVIELGQ